MRCFKVTIEYDGTDFAGFQYQVGQRSVQAEIEKAIFELTGQDVRINGAGRTDAGVHAVGQVIGFRAETRIPTERLSVALNSALPSDVAAVGAEEVGERFHARFSAASRRYVYLILNREHPSAIYGRYSHHVRCALDVARMRESAAALVGVHDFTSWANDLREAGTPVRHVTSCSAKRSGDFVIIRIEANAFLKGMVRNVVGTLLEIGAGKRAVEDMRAITEARDRAAAGPCAPAKGLCLVRVRYASGDEEQR